MILGKWDQPPISLPRWSVLGPIMWQRLVTHCYRPRLPLRGVEVWLDSSLGLGLYFSAQSFIWAKHYGWGLTSGMWRDMMHGTSKSGPRKPPADPPPLFPPTFPLDADTLRVTLGAQFEKNSLCHSLPLTA